jgi:hypothetical protein
LILSVKNSSRLFQFNPIKKASGKIPEAFFIHSLFVFPPKNFEPLTAHFEFAEGGIYAAQGIV